LSGDDVAGRLEELLGRLERARAELETTEDPEKAIDVLAELAELARDVQREVERARGEGGGAVS
jgi:hypothetical protein